MYNQEILRLVDEIAIAAMQSLISKMPLLDREGTVGKPIDQEELNQIKDDLCKSAYDYAYRMMQAKKEYEKYFVPSSGNAVPN